MPRASRRRVVVTGIGCVTPVANDLETAWQAILSGKSGAGDITLVDHSDFDVHFACEVKGFNPADYMGEKTAKRCTRFVHFALAASKMAAAAHGLGEFIPERAGAVYASSLGGIKFIEEQCEVYKAKGPKRISAIGLPILIINNAPVRMAIDFGLKGPNYAVAATSAGPLHAIGLAARHIQDGEADLMFTGGAEAAISIVLLGSLAVMRALSRRNDDPAAASRPFDRDRDGLVLGEGAGTLILEELEHAKARNAPILAEIKGAGFASDAYSIISPDPGGGGLARAMLQALRDSGLSPGDIEYVSADGTSTQQGDRAEAAALRRVFGADIGKVAISSTKGQTGHLLGAAGAVESIFTIMAMRNRIVPPTINFHNPDSECGIEVVANQPRERKIRHALVNGFGLGGHCASLCLARYEE